MQGKLRLGLALSCLMIAILTPQFASIFVPNARAAKTANASTIQTIQSPYTWKDLLSGGLWAGLNNLPNNYTTLDSAQASAVIGSPSPDPSPSQAPTSPFTNNFRVTGDYSLRPFEDEPSIAVTNQSGHVLMVVGANSLSARKMVAYLSKDQGTHWMGPSFLPFSRGNDTFASDPALGVDRTGTFYYGFLSINLSGRGQDDVVVATSQDGGNWTNHVVVQRRHFPNNSTISFELFDKDYLTIGPSKSNASVDAVYVTYTDFVGHTCSSYFTCPENSTIMEVHSTDGGVTWSQPVAVSPTVTISTFSFTGRMVQGSMPAVAPKGDLYVAYYDSGNDGWLNGTASVMITKSLDGGKTFPVSPTQAALIPQELTYWSGDNFFGFRWWTSMFPSMDVAPDGTVYIAYGARESQNSLDPADVYLVASTDQGVTWSQPNKINDSSSQNGRFFAWLRVSADGIVHVIWGDQRLDPAGVGYDIFYAESPNHGATISTNIRVTDVSSNPLFTFLPFVGDYFNLAVSGNQVYPVWTDERRAIRPLGSSFLFGDTDIFAARLGPRDTPTITMGSSPPAGYQTPPVTILGTSLPRDAYFVMRMNGAGLLSQKYGIILAFSNKSGNLSDIIIPNTNYYGAYPVELDEWLSGARVAVTNLYVVDTRSLQVIVAGPPTAFPSDSVTWNLHLVPAGGSLNPQGFTSTLTVAEALLTAPDGSVQDLTANVRSTGLGSYSLSTMIPNNAGLGAYGLFVSASQTGPIVQSVGVGTATLVVSRDVRDFTLIAGPTSISTKADSTGTSTITLIGLNGFTGTVELTHSVSPATGLSCSLSTSSIPLGIYASSTLSCTGSPRTYTVTITGTVGHTSHSTTVTVIVESGASTIFGVSPLLFYGSTGGIVAAIVLAILGTFVALRQRRVQ